MSNFRLFVNSGFANHSVKASFRGSYRELEQKVLVIQQVKRSDLLH